MTRSKRTWLNKACSCAGTIVDATIIAAPSSIKNQTGTRDPEMHQTKEDNQWHSGMKAHIGADADSGLVLSIIATAANVNDVTQVGALLHGEEQDTFSDAGYQGMSKREEAQGPRWHVAMRPDRRRTLDPSRPIDAVTEQMERVKARAGAKVEHPFHVIKNLFRYRNVRYRGLVRNEAQLVALSALANLVIAKRRLFALQARGVS